MITTNKVSLKTDDRWTKEVTETIEDDWYEMETAYTTPDGYRVVNITDGANRWLVLTPSGHPQWRSTAVRNLDSAYRVIEKMRSEQ